MKKKYESMDRARAKYDAKKTVQVKMKLNKNTDADILAHLATLENKQGYLKQLIRDDMNRE